MAYNYYPTVYPYQQNYYPATYQPIQQPMQQQYQAQMPSVQPSIQQNGIIWVNSGIEAQAYPVAPNAAVTLWSTAEPVVYLKKADASGKPTLITYDLVERKDAPVKQTDIKTETYATKEDLSVVAGAVKGFDDIITGLKSDIDAMKSDMYGIAGKKKKVKEDSENE